MSIGRLLKDTVNSNIWHAWLDEDQFLLIMFLEYPLQ